MPGYISEFQYYGNTSEEFIEVALPTGTDPSGYGVEIYDHSGSLIWSFPLGTSTQTISGYDVYVVNAGTPLFDDGEGDPTGNLYPDDGIALVDGDGNVDQFVSYWGNTVTGTEGAVSGLTSTDVGTAGAGETLQSDDRGASYYAQSSTNSGTIPACYAPGSLIATPDGMRPVEQLFAGDHVLGVEGKVHTVRWIWAGQEPLDDLETDKKPVLIRASALGADLPAQDLIVSGQHRIVVGAFGQLEDIFDRPLMVPAKALTHHPGVRFMAGKRSIIWHHFLCDEHCVVFANGVASETLLLGSAIVQPMSRCQLAELSQALRRTITSHTIDTPVLPCMTVGAARTVLKGRKKRWFMPVHQWENGELEA